MFLHCQCVAVTEGEKESERKNVPWSIVVRI